MCDPLWLRYWSSARFRSRNEKLEGYTAARGPADFALVGGGASSMQ